MSTNIELLLKNNKNKNLNCENEFDSKNVLSGETVLNLEKDNTKLNLKINKLKNKINLNQKTILDLQNNYLIISKEKNSIISDFDEKYFKLNNDHDILSEK